MSCWTRYAPVLICSILIFFFLHAGRTDAWGKDGHYITCAIAQSLLKPAALKAVQSLLPHHVGGRLANLCSWANEMRLLEQWHWSIPLHFVETPDFLCNYDYARDCQSLQGHRDMCTAGAINNYTSQLASYHSSKHQCKLTPKMFVIESLLSVLGTVRIYQNCFVKFHSDMVDKTDDQEE